MVNTVNRVTTSTLGRHWGHWGKMEPDCTGDGSTHVVQGAVSHPTILPRVLSPPDIDARISSIVK